MCVLGLKFVIVVWMCCMLCGSILVIGCVVVLGWNMFVLIIV